MTQRNPMNERNTLEDGKKGVTKKSASSVKIKREAAGSVVVADPKKKKKKKGSIQKASEDSKTSKMTEARRREMEIRYQNPPTKEYKNARRIWIISIAVAAIGGIGTWITAALFENSAISLALLVPAWVGIILAFYMDLGKMRKIRKKYTAQMMMDKAEQKSVDEAAKKRIAEDEARAAAKAAKKEARKAARKGNRG